ncbi:MAG TPA: YhdH/YhfP family quinone oxidoreductase, partial [Pirellulales bacterium]|nr:YhdH/YhfP family quinone oxidoreductase [Pirellulales bacterium]
MSTPPTEMACFVATRQPDGTTRGAVEWRPIGDLPPGDVLIRVAYSSLNYKDALSASGHPGITKHYPHVPGIDAAGHVIASNSDRIQVGQTVIVTGYELGATRWGGYAQFIRVPADWPIVLPARLSLRESMIYGTAGFTAAQCVAALRLHGVQPDKGEIVVTGASGGVGSLAVAILGRLGYHVVAVSGKPAAAELLGKLGVKEILTRDAVVDTSTKPLLSARWAGAVDTVGGATLATILRSLNPGACATACGLVGGVELPLTVYPFILRGVSLVGIDSAWPTTEVRE